MGWSYRKSTRIGPFRVNFSRSGVGYSVGVKGFRAGINSRGRSYTSVSIPGTGLRYTSSPGKPQAGCLIMVVAALAACGAGAGCGLCVALRLLGGT